MRDAVSRHEDHRIADRGTFVAIDQEAPDDREGPGGAVLRYGGTPTDAHHEQGEREHEQVTAVVETCLHG